MKQLQKKKYQILFLFLTVSSFAQEPKSISQLNDSIGYYIRYKKLEDAKRLIDILSSKEFNSFEDKFLLDQNKFYYHYLKRDFEICSKIIYRINNYETELLEKTKSAHYINIAFLKKAQNQIDSSALYYTKSLKFYEKDSTKFYSKKATVYIGLYSLYRQLSNKEKELHYLKLYLKTVKKANLTDRIAYGLNNLAVYYDKNKNPQNALKYFKEALIYMEPPIERNTILQNIGSIYLKYFKQEDSSKYYNQKALNKYTTKRTLAYIHRDNSIIAKRKKNYILENKELHLALKNILLDPFQELELELYKALYQNNKNQKNYKESLLYYEKYNRLNDTIKKQSMIEKVEEIQTKYETEKKEKELVLQKKQTIEEQQKNKDKNNLLIGAFFFIALASGMGYLTLKNSRKKQLLAEQQKELETQKNLTLLKEQEITTINAMIDGQEKERTRIAEDLHDNLGSVIATLKLHFDNLRINQKKKKIDQEILFDKTESLIDEAYKKVRSIAHAKNAGVIANQGLLVAVKLMAEKISSANSIQIEVIDFGLEKRLENSLEISLFRIIQELTTNIIKHAQATKATISISQHEKEINVLLEDNGIGMDISKIYLQKGMGLDSIKTRVTHLQGNFTVDSTPTKGTTIIINIPT